MKINYKHCIFLGIPEKYLRILTRHLGNGWSVEKLDLLLLTQEDAQQFRWIIKNINLTVHEVKEWVQTTDKIDAGDFAIFTWAADNNQSLYYWLMRHPKINYEDKARAYQAVKQSKNRSAIAQFSTVWEDKMKKRQQVHGTSTEKTNKTKDK